MGIRPIRKPDKLPAARLYLDDIQEITAVLIKYTPQDARGQPVVKYTVGEYECDAPDNLLEFGKEHGRRAIKFAITTFSGETSRAEAGFLVDRHSTRCALLCDAEEKACQEIRQILESRGIWWRNLPEAVRLWIAFGLGTGVFSALALFLRSMRLHRTASGAAIAIALGLLAVIAGAYSLTLEHSVVHLEYSHAKRGIRGFLARNWEKIVMVVIGAAVGTVITILGQRWLK